MLFACVLVVMAVTGLVFVLCSSLLGVNRLNLIRDLAAFEDVDFGGGDSAAIDFFDPEACVEIERGSCVVEHLLRHSGVNQRSEKHIACNPCEAVKISDAHQVIFPGDFTFVTGSGALAIDEAGSTSFIEPER